MLAELLRPKAKRLKIESYSYEPTLRTPYECYLCEPSFGKLPCFPSHEALIEHHQRDHRYKRTGIPLEKKLGDHTPPKVVTRTDIKKPSDFVLRIKCMFSKHPKYDFIQFHQSSYSSNIPQVILFDRSKKVRVAMSIPEALEKVRTQ